MQFVRIQPGAFTMGSASGDACERPPHTVRITIPFEMGKYEVTQAQWESIMGSNPSGFKGADLPVDTVSWEDVQQFLGRLNAMQSRYRYRLPTEAEWEYAARAGSTSDQYGNLDDIAWWQRNSGYGTRPVGRKQPNAWGIYDMLGNVWEWCQDWYDERYYDKSPGDDPTGPSAGSYHVLRGGSWQCVEQALRVSKREWFANFNMDSGFRCVREVAK